VSELDDVDFFTNKSLVVDPYPYYDALRACPVRRDPKFGVVMVSGYDELAAVLRDDREDFSLCNVVSGPWPGIPVEDERDDISDLIEQHRHTLPLSDYFASFDPPKHTAYRSLLGRLLTPKRLRENEAFLWRLADETLDRFIERGSCEFVTDYGFPFTMVAIADLLGVPDSDHVRFASEPQFMGLGEGERNNIGVPDEWFVDYVEERRRNPGDDVLTQLAQATFPDGTTPDALEVARVATFLFAAGQGTTVDLLSSALLMLAEQPHLQQLLRDGRERIPSFIEEMLRYESPVKCNFRLVRRSMSVGDVDVKAGTNVLVMVGAANRDPRRFDEPNEFRLDRANVLEHVGFGRGIHACPGAPLARAEARVSLERILDRMADIRLSEAEHGPPGDRRFRWERTFLLRRLKALHLQFTPAAQ